LFLARYAPQTSPPSPAPITITSYFSKFSFICITPRDTFILYSIKSLWDIEDKEDVTVKESVGGKSF